MEDTSVIRASTINDFEIFAKISVTCWQQAYSEIMPAAFLEGLDWQARIAGREKFFADLKRKSFVYVLEGQIVGFCDLGPTRTVAAIPKLDANYAEIYAIYVLPKYQRRGIGKKLFEYGVEYLTENRFTKILIWCLVDNKWGRDFYIKCGCAETSWHKDIKIHEREYSEIAYIF